MKKKTFQVNIPEPCNEDWSKMTPQEQGRFCGKCAKTIIDYSYQSDRAIAKVLKENNGQICGRFRSDQLQRDLVLEPQFYQNTRWKAFGLMISGLLMAGTLKGEETPQIRNKAPFEVIKNDLNISQIENQGKETIIISGQVIDKEIQEGLIGATIQIENTDIGTYCDLEGKFNLEISADEFDLFHKKIKLIVSYTGYSTKKISIKKNKLIKAEISIGNHLKSNTYNFDIPVINLEESIEYTAGVVAFHYAYPKEETLYQLVTNKIHQLREKRADKRK